MKKRRIGAGLVVLAGMVVGVFALLTALQHGNRADAVTTSTCVVPPNKTVANVVIGSGTATLAVDSAGHLTLNSVACTTSAPPGSNSVATLTGISLSVATPGVAANIPTRVVLSETGPGGVIPCAISITGSLSYPDPTTQTTTASTVPLEVDGAAGKGLTAGTSGGANGVDANGCGAPDVTLTGMGSYDLVAASNPTAVTLSAGGGTGFDGTTTIPTTLDGTAQGTAGVPDTFVAGDSSEAFLTNTPGSTLDFSSACAPTPNPCTLTANSSSAASVATATGLAQYTASITGNAVSSPSPTYTYGPNGDFTTIDGLGSGSTNFYPDVSPAAYQVNGNNVNVIGSAAGSYTVTIAGPGGSGQGTNDQVTAGATAETFTVTGSGLTVNGSSGTTTFTVAPPTGTTGNNTFVPGSGAANFYATGTANTVDFTNVLTSGSNAELTINKSGAPQGVGTGGATILPNGGAAVGSVPTYSFLNSATSTSASHFTTFKGAATGFTQFLAGPTGGLTFIGQGVANSNGASFLGSASGVVANLSGSTVVTSANIGAGTTLSGFTLPDGQVLVAPPTGTSCPAASCDTIADLTNVTGPSFGNSTFYAGNTSGNIYNFSDSGNSNTFYGGASTDVFGSTGNGNDYVAGSGSATFNESAQQSPNNTIDFSHVPVGAACSTLGPPNPVTPCSLTVNVSGQQTAVPNFGAAVLDAQNNKIRTYGFATGGPNFTTFIGAFGGSTTFQGGLGGYTYTGKGTGNTLDFSDVSSSVANTLTFDVTSVTTQSATLANVPETFSGVTTLVGLASGNTVFTGGSTGGYTFKGNGSGNTATFICGGAIINLSTTAVTSGTTTVDGGQAYVPGAGPPGPCAANASSKDTLVDISTVNDARTGSGTQTADTFVAGSGSEVFGDITDSPGDTIDFSNVNTGSGAPLTVNVSGAFASGVANNTATVGGGATYTFISGGADLIGADFTTFVGPTRGFATFLAGDPAGHTFAAKGTNNSIDYSAATGGVTVNLSTATGTVSEGILPADTITGLTTVTGSSAGGNNFTAGSQGPYNFTGNGNGNTFTGGSGVDVFSSNGNNNDFIAGSGSATFNDGGSANKLDFTSVGSSLVVNVSGVQVGTTVADVATSSSGATYTFTTFGTNPTTIVGSMQGTSFFGGTATDTFLGQGLPSDTLSFLHTQSAGPLSINVVGTNCASPATYGQATVNSIQESFCGIKSFVGLPSGINTFAADSTGGYTYSGSGGTNTADFTAATSGINANLATGVVTVNTGPCPGTGCDTVSGVTSIRGASVGGNTFVAGQGSETFSAGGAGNAIDFSNLATGSGTALTINVSGIAINNVSNDTATFNGAMYNFQSGGSGFTNLTGATNGNTVFEAGSTPGYTLTGNGPSNSVDLSHVTCGGVNVNLAPTRGSVSFLGSCPGGSDTVSGLTTAVGSTSGGNRFEAGAAAATYTFTGNGNGNTFVGDPDPSAANAIDVFSSNGAQNVFTAGSGAATFNDSTPGNTIDFSAVAARLTVNVSGGQVGGTANDTASGGNPYTFSTFGAAQTTIKGSSGGTTFDAGTSPDTFIGTGPAANNQLSFAAPSLSGQLTITPVLACPAPGSTPLGRALFNSVNQPFCNIAMFAGLPGGNSTFVADSTSGYTFTATGTNNTADFSSATSGITADLSSQAAGNVILGSGTDTVTGVTSVFGSAAGHNTFVAGTSSETFGDTGTGGGDAMNFSHVVTSSTAPLFVNASSAPVNNSVNSDTASNGSLTDTFTTGGANFTTFIGASSGFTKFSAPADIGGYTFCAKGTGSTCALGALAGDSADFSANSSGITANLSPSPESTNPGPELFNGQVSVGTSTPLDTVSGMANLIGSSSSSASAPNTFYGGLTGTTFSSAGSANAVSYVGLAALAPLPAGSCGGVKVGMTGVSLIPPASPSCSTFPNKADTFAFPSGSSLSIQGSPGNDDFLVGTAPVSLSGGGGTDALDFTAVQAASGTPGVAVNLNTGSVAIESQPAMNMFTPGCGPNSQADLCVSSVTGSHGDDTYTVGSSGPPLALTGNGGNDTMDLSALLGSAAVAMPPTPSGQGSVTDTSTGTITFTGVPNIVGTASGGDTFTAGTGTESFTESSNPSSAPGILDFSKVGSSTAGVTVNVGQVGGVPSGTTTSAPAANVNDSFTNITTFIGTQGPDTFKQSGAGTYNFEGSSGSNVLDLSNAPSGVRVNLNGIAPPPYVPPTGACTTGINANNGTATGGGVTDTFTCMVQVIGAGTPVFDVYPNTPQTATLNGGGDGTLMLMNGTAGVTVNLQNGTVTGKDYNFKFSGMNVVDGTPFNDMFVPGAGNVTINGGGGSDGVTFNGAPAITDTTKLGQAYPATPPAQAAVVANLSTSSYTVPAGFTGAGTSIPPMTATGGYGGTITMQGIANLIGTKQFNDVLVGGATPGSLISGGSGNDRFVLGGGDTFVSGGTGTGTSLDLSLLLGHTTFDLGKSYPQNTGAGTVTVAPNSIHTVLASPGGSNLSAGTGNVTLVGGSGNDTLAGGNGTQTLIGGGGTDTLIAGVGNQALQGGGQPVTFVPGGCLPNNPCSDTLTSSGTGNTLDYSAAPPTANCTATNGPPCGVEVNLSSQLFTVPQNEPMGGKVLPLLSATGGSGANVNLAQAGITTVNGSPQPDILVTGSSGDTVNGGGGDDLIVANGGNNFLAAGTGTKTTFLFNGAGNNVIKGGGQATVDFSQAPVGVTVDLQHGTASGGFGGFQSLTGVLNAAGTNFNDTLIAGLPGGTITGLNGGADFLQSGPNGGDTLVSGGSASDTFCAEVGCEIGGTLAGGGNTMFGGFGNDIFFVRNGAVDTIDGSPKGFNGPAGSDQAQVDPFDITSNIERLLP